MASTDSIEINNIHDMSTQPVFRSKTETYVLDQNNGNYQPNQILIDTQSISQSNQWNLYNEGYLTVPYTITATCNAQQSVPFGVCFKAPGYSALIDQVQLQLNGVSVNNQQQGLPLLDSYKKTINWGLDKIQQAGSVVGYAPDSSVSGYGCTGALSGSASCINNVATQGNNTTIPNVYNSGVLSRALAQHSWPYSTTGAYNVPSTITNYYTFSSTTCTWNGMAIIPLTSIHPIFESLDFPIKNCRWNMALTLSYNSTTQKGVVCPLMITDQGTNSGITSATLTIGGSGRTCQLNVPTVVMDPSVESKYLETYTKKVVKYMDFQYFNFTSIATSGSSFTQQLFTGIPNLKKILLFPNVSASSCSGGKTPYQQLTAAQPGLLSTEGVSLGNIQMSLNNVNLFQNPIQYDWQMFLQNVAEQNVNGFFIDNHISSGQSYLNWLNAKWYVFDCERSNLPKNEPIGALISAQNQSYTKQQVGFSIDLTGLALYESAIEINVATGQVSKILSSLL